MNQSRARKIRKKIYGEMSRRDDKYRLIKRIKKIFVKDDKDNLVEQNKTTGQLLCVGLRADYKRAKKEYYKERRTHVQSSNP